ncbi:MAG: thioredoxin domain-containing protein [Actinomycetota bacterium]|nr:thioredoxin domain-containing protein [Actinomycetota bacterium]
MLGANGRVVVDFYVDWCGPCRWDESVPFVKVDIDESPRLAQKYGVFSIPTIILFDNGEVAAQTMGTRPAAAIERELGLDNDHASPGDDQHVH